MELDLKYKINNSNADKIINDILKKNDIRLFLNIIRYFFFLKSEEIIPGLKNTKRRSYEYCNMIAQYWHKKHPNLFTYNTKEDGIIIQNDLLKSVPIGEWNILRLFRRLHALGISLTINKEINGK